MRKMIKKDGFPYTQELVMLLVLFLISLSFAIAIFSSKKVEEVTPGVGIRVPVTVNKIEVSLIDSFPLEANVKVYGSKEDSCPSKFSLNQKVNGKNIELSIIGTREDEKCIGKEGNFEEVFPLDILDLKKGVYNVILQDATTKIELPIDNTIELQDEIVAMDMYTLDETSLYKGYIPNPIIPAFLISEKTFISSEVKKGPNTALSYHALLVEDVGYSVFYLPTGSSVLSSSGDYEIFYDKFSSVFVAKNLKTNQTNYYLMGEKGAKPELITTVTQ